jgi:hypothetical protein
VVARLKGAGHILGEQHHSHGKPTGQRLGQDQEVRADARGLVGQEGAGAADPALDLVQDEEDLPLPG